jgi:beta-mannosidase
MWVAEADWEYQLTFSPNHEIYQGGEVYLVADGLDTIAEVYLNHNLLGKVNNQFRQWRWEIKKHLHEGENQLLIKFSGPSTYVTHQQERRRMKGVTQAIEGGPHMRKAPCQFGWDWGPMLPPIGIWKDIRLETYPLARLMDVHLRQIHEEKAVALRTNLEIERWQPGELQAIVEVTDPNGHQIRTLREFKSSTVGIELEIDSPILWWPNGYGSQDLYRVDVFLKREDKAIDHKSFSIGLRTIELVQEEDDFGKSFQFVVNGIPIFAKGSNWIPADSFLTRFSDDRLENLIAAAAASHQNMLRVWGGGIYEEERFYDLCDRYGILVWQDFIFSCSIYPLDEPDFFENVRVEVAENIKRLRHRASLALWCGNNEMEWGWESWGWQKNPLEDQLPTLIQQFPQLQFLLELVGERDLLPDWDVLKNAYDQFFHHTLPKWVSILDPDTAYWPSSPSSNKPFHDVNSPQMGDAHYWDVWHGRKPFTAYRSTYPRFMSEFGFQAFPTMETIEYYTQPQDRNLTSYIMEHHQRGNHGNGLIIAQMTDTFRMPKDFVAWIYLSLILQAEGIRYGVEHWRRNMHRVSGTLYWQLNDCWPVASWASIDYFGRWKALHYAAKRFYEPVLLSIEDDGPMMRVNISNDRTTEFTGKIIWSLETVKGETIDAGNFEISVDRLANSLIHEFDFSGKVNKTNQHETVLICELWQGKDLISTCVNTFVPNKHFSLSKPGIKSDLTLKGNKLVINLTAKSLARFVEIKLKGVEVKFSDNYFDIPPDRSVQISCEMPEGWTQKMADEALRIYSLFDSF